MSDSALTEQTGRELTAETTALRTEVNTLSTAITKVETRQDDSERRGRFFGWLLTVAVLVVVVLGVLLWQIAQTSATVERAIQLGICPTAAIIVGGSVSNPRPEGAQADYLRALDSLSRTREVLGCNDPLIPPRITS